MATSLEKTLQKAIEAPDIVVGLRAFGLTQNDISTVTKVSPPRHPRLEGGQPSTRALRPAR